MSTAYLWSKSLAFMREMSEARMQYGLTLTIKPQFLTLLSGIYSERIPIHRQGHEQEYLDYIISQNPTHLLITTVAISADTDNADVVRVLKAISEPSFSLDYEAGTKPEPIIILLALNRRA